MGFLSKELTGEFCWRLWCFDSKDYLDCIVACLICCIFVSGDLAKGSSTAARTTTMELARSSRVTEDSTFTFILSFCGF